MKKRLLFLSVLALSLASCTKPLERMASVRFSLGKVEVVSGQMGVTFPEWEEGK